MPLLTQYMSSQFSWLQLLDFALRLLVACACGAFIGFERTSRLKEAGIRTHVIVACASALFIIVSKYGFADLTFPDGAVFNGTRGADPARIAAQVVSGISFLGAGVIFKNGSTVKGLTTAAGIWATAAIGLAIGAGMYVIGLFATVVVAVVQMVMHKFTVGADAYGTTTLVFTVRDETDIYAVLNPKLKDWGAQITESQVNRSGKGLLEYTLTLRTLHAISFEDVDAIVRNNPEILSGSNQSIK